MAGKNGGRQEKLGFYRKCKATKDDRFSFQHTEFQVSLWDMCVGV